MLPDSAELRVKACWERTLTVAELCDLLHDHREWSFGGYRNFDGDGATTVVCVAAAAVRALAATEPASAPMAAVAAAVARTHGRVREIIYTNYTSPYEEPLRWQPSDLSAFGQPLIDELRRLANDVDVELSQGARDVLADIGSPET